ncbi:SIR2 family NAD-dependent protein deacylase [Imtechella halotolerans]|uniref:NAD-dependent protein deacylase n=1 Tax=Imtechella halotolerans K1 TaxID=946077 RepID=I0W9G6_9FLAO|nr:NAD-dependent deacylase [Imtechella halotolerans]EID73032.1 NAD-dependent protein deacetylase [Imtechella halotolerans K1]WMQ62129.1 NAD-dependent deacylase [Imtechella halotolerans]
MKKKIAVLSGAGISAESGIKTFRDADGLWEGHDIMEVASPEGFARNPELVLDFYNQRRKQLLTVAPNAGHKALVSLEELYEVSIITQNVDDLHERAGSSHIIHLHGELLKARSTRNEHLIYHWTKDIVLGDRCQENHQLRPHIVWFGEAVPMITPASKIVSEADIVIIVGTSMQVYPAAGLIEYSTKGTPIYFIDPRPALQSNISKNLTVIQAPATEGLPVLVSQLLGN